MNRKPLFILLLVLALVSMACRISIDLPLTDVKTGPTVIDEISIPLLSDPSSVANVTLSFGAGKLTLSPGAANAILSGTATYNVEDFKPQISADGTLIRIEQGDLNLKGIPNFKDDVRNEWDLQFGTAPVRLEINAGAYIGEYELGGLNLRGLKISDGASDVRLSFSEPNLSEMDTFDYNTGASNVRMTGLANLNFSTMFFRGGAGSYSLDFTGDLQRDATVSIESGISSLIIIVPEGVPASIKFEGGLSNVSESGTWQKSGSTYTQPGDGPEITILVQMAAGNLDLRNR